MNDLHGGLAGNHGGDMHPFGEGCCNQSTQSSTQESFYSNLFLVSKKGGHTLGIHQGHETSGYLPLKHGSLSDPPAEVWKCKPFR